MIPTLSHIYAYQLQFPKPGSFCKTAFSVLGSQTGFRVRFWKSHHCIHCKSAGRGLQTATLLKELLLTLSHRSKRAFIMPPCLPGIECVTVLKILGVTITGKLSE